MKEAISPVKAPVDLHSFAKERAVRNIINARREMSATSEFNGGGGGGGMDDILRRLDSLEKEISSKPGKAELEVLELKIKNNISDQMADLKDFLHNELSKVPSEDRIKTVIDEKSKSLDLATKTHVSEQIHKLNNKMIIWVVGTAIAVASLAVSAIKLFMK